MKLETVEKMTDEELLKFLTKLSYERWQNSKDEEHQRIFRNVWHTIQYD